MKKITLLLGIFMVYCIVGYAQTLSTTSTSVASGSTITVKASGETTSAYFVAEQGDMVWSVPAGYNQYLSNLSITFMSATYYNKTTHAPTTFQYKLINTSSVPIAVTYRILALPYDDVTISTLPQVTQYITVTVTPVATVYHNTAQSRSIARNNCGTGYLGSSVTYTVPANTYSSTISQADADGKATADINTNGQTYANAHGTCTVAYYNVAASQTFTPVCGSGMVYTGPNVTYTVPANTYVSTISQADANSKAQADITANGQTYANTHNTGTCTIPTIPVTLHYGVSSSGLTFQIQFSPTGSTPGSTVTYNFNSTQIVNIPAGVYNVYMHGPGSPYTFSYGTCATTGSSTGPAASFSNLNICGSSNFYVN